MSYKLVYTKQAKKDAKKAASSGLKPNIKNLLDNKLLDIPNYIKIDVDGTEHLILKGMGKYLQDPKIKSILVEINENFKIQFKTIIYLYLLLWFCNMVLDILSFNCL